MQRRTFLHGMAALAAWGGLPGVLHAQNGAGAQLVVVGGGFAGATCARYLKLWAPRAEVVLVEPEESFIACPMSNRVVAGSMSIRDLTRSHALLASRHGVKLVRDRMQSFNPGTRQIVLAGGGRLAYDRLVLAPGVDLAYDELPGLEDPRAQAAVLHAWKAGEQTHELRRRIAALPAGGVLGMHVPKAPFRCHPGPYERACLVAGMLKRSNPRAKILLFDSNPDVLAKRELFKQAFGGRYKGMIEYVPNAGFEAMDVATQTLRFDVHEPVKADLWNVIPPQRAAAVARTGGLAATGQRWCEVDFLSYESTLLPNVHVIGDAVASGLPKSAHMANQQAKVCAAAIAARLAGREVNAQPMIANTCYSFVTDKEAIHVASVYAHDSGRRSMVEVAGAGGVSAAPSSEEGFFAVAWAFNILNDTLGAQGAG